MNESDEVAALRVDANAGDAEAQCRLGGRYLGGQGVPLDFAQSVSWYRKAAEQGNADAQQRATDWLAAFEQRGGK